MANIKDPRGLLVNGIPIVDSSGVLTHPDFVSAKADNAYNTIVANNNVYTIPIESKAIYNAKVGISDNTAKEIIVTNPIVGTELFIELTYTDGAAITWTMNSPATITWLNGVPSFTDGKVYRIALFYYATNVWHGNAVGGW